jgi:hypothetical protein
MGKALAASRIWFCQKDDFLEERAVEDEVEELMKKTEVPHNFFTQCRSLLEHWGPDVGWDGEAKDYRSMDSAVTRPRRTTEMEAAARMDCKLRSKLGCTCCKMTEQRLFHSKTGSPLIRDGFTHRHCG